MDVEMISNLISSVGFPIFVCLVLFWFIKNYLDKFLTAINDFNINIEKNTNSLENLASKIEDISNV